MKYLKQILVGVAVALLGGMLDARMALSRLEAQLSAVDRRVERIEREIDSQRTFAVGD